MAIANSPNVTITVRKLLEMIEANTTPKVQDDYVRELPNGKIGTCSVAEAAIQLDVDPSALASRLQGIAFGNAGIKITLTKKYGATTSPYTQTVWDLDDLIQQLSEASSRSKDKVAQAARKAIEKYNPELLDREISIRGLGVFSDCKGC